jgi:mannose-6-phosphate isomerase-like protein (cupin superfamily)
MIAAKLHHRARRPDLLAVLGIAGVVALAGAAVARRLRSGARDVPEARRTVKAGNGIVNPLIGHEFRFFGHRFHLLESARDTGDGTLQFDYSAPPRASVSEHVHHDQEESFEVVSGKLGVRVRGQEVLLTPGQSGVGPPGIPHAW